MEDDSTGGFPKDEDVKIKQCPSSAGDTQPQDAQKDTTSSAVSSPHIHSAELATSGIINGVVTESSNTLTDRKTVSSSLDEVVNPVSSASRKTAGPEHSGDLEYDDEDDDDNGDDEWVSEEGDESDIEDNVELAFPLRRRESNPILPGTVTVLETPQGCKVYVVGTAHFSMESQEDVARVVQAVQPDVVMLELCKSRINILELDEEMLLEEAKNINLEKFRLAIKQSGVVQGIMHLLLLSMSAHLTKQLGMAPGGEFRRAFHEARLVPGCRLQLGDRPIQITLKRALGTLTIWQKLKLAWYLITTKDPISKALPSNVHVRRFHAAVLGQLKLKRSRKEDVEKCKQRDLLEQLLKEMTGEFPALSKVFVEERDIYLTHSLKLAARSREHPSTPEVTTPTVVVGVVGIGHVPGIIANWSKEQDIKDIITVPPGSMLGKIVKWSIRASLLCALSYGCYRLYRWTSHALL
ncbi:traB domain-containing protein-like isoform X2 [Babylonia areolata]|uniref:traB domain-containing protein-like isoform X2 n=1 Tax=Babylonia areolata TaxID=304850 RepID=UPI003FCF4DFC